jgi:TDG/mug DNA glycosylase family protein
VTDEPRIGAVPGEVGTAPDPFGAVPDIVGPSLRVLFCGINPGLRSAETGRHFARPGNRFWRVLHAAGFTDRVMSPDQQDELPALGIGITNLVRRASAAASELSTADLRAGGADLERRVGALRPGTVAVLGAQAYRTAFRVPRAAIGEQPVRLAGTRLWVLPNPSGLQARYQLPEMTVLYRHLAAAAGFAPVCGRDG